MNVKQFNFFILVIRLDLVTIGNNGGKSRNYYISSENYENQASKLETTILKGNNKQNLLKTKLERLKNNLKQRIDQNVFEKKLMNKRKQGKACVSEETSNEDICEPNLTKKVLTSEITKEPVKTTATTTLKNEKDENPFIKKQEDILMNIENINIEQHVKELCSKFDPPMCANCPKRRADRVCINKSCGEEYMQIICGKCHMEVHEKQQNKTEIDIEEYFIKLATFLNTQKYLPEDKKMTSHMKVEKFRHVFEEISLLREKFGELKAKIGSELENYESPQDIQSHLQTCITNALSLCNFENMQLQLSRIRKDILFKKNQFLWNDVGQKYIAFSNIFSDIQTATNSIDTIISQSFTEGIQIDLNEVKFLPSLINQGLGMFGGVAPQIPSIKGKDNEIVISSNSNQTIQYYMDYKLEPEKKYKLRFRFGTNPSQYIMVGLMPFSLAQSQYVYNIQNEFFCKRFFSHCPTQECSRIVKGSDLQSSITKDTQIEMRVDFKENYVDFSDYPNHNNINANHKHFKLRTNENYTIAFCLCQSQSIVIESLEQMGTIEIN